MNFVELINKLYIDCVNEELYTILSDNITEFANKNNLKMTDEIPM